jgi:hypothetical protein
MYRTIELCVLGETSNRRLQLKDERNKRDDKKQTYRSGFSAKVELMAQAPTTRDSFLVYFLGSVRTSEQIFGRNTCKKWPPSTNLRTSVQYANADEKWLPSMTRIIIYL